MDKVASKFFTSFTAGRACLNFRRFTSYEAEPFLRRDVRRRDVLPKNPNQLNALMNGADYSYVDGRPTPYGTRQLRRMEKQQQYTAKIIQLTREVDMAKATHKRQVTERDQQIQNIIDSKLKPKGRTTL